MAHTDADQSLHEFALDENMIVRASRQYGPVTGRNSGISKTVAGLFQFPRNLVVHMRE